MHISLLEMRFTYFIESKKCKVILFIQILVFNNVLVRFLIMFFIIPLIIVIDLVSFHVSIRLSCISWVSLFSIFLTSNGEIY